jgi:mitochondrial ATPase complex subunit ATP10
MMLGDHNFVVQLCKIWPFKGMLLNAAKQKAQADLTRMRARHVHYFGDDQVATEVLGMTNRLTGYVFVVDEDGRIRWQSSGKMLEVEAHAMLKAVRTLVQEHHPEFGRGEEDDVRLC